MKFFEEVKAPLREKSGKKLMLVSTVIFLLVTAIIFVADFQLCKSVSLGMMDDYLGEIPKIIESRANELLMRRKVYEDDILTRAEIGMKLYAEEDGLSDAEKLEQIRRELSADSVSLLDGQRKLLSTTGIACPEESFNACVETLAPRVPDILFFYPTPVGEGAPSNVHDGRGVVLLPVPGNTAQSLAFEFACDKVLELYNALGNWKSVLERMLSGADGAAAFARSEGEVTGYPLDWLTPEQTTRLFEELNKVFDNSDSFRSRAGGRPNKIISLLGERYLAALWHDEQFQADILVTAPLKSVVSTGMYCAAAISAIIGCGLLLVQLYVFKQLQRKKHENNMKKVSGKWVRQATWPGIVIVVMVTAVFSCMLVMLENRANASFTAISKRESLQQEINWHREQEGTIRSTFAELYRQRTQILADYLTEHPEYQTREGLKELNDIAGTDYLMRFDKNGQERFSSNSYTGFSVGANLSEEYRAVLLGYPYAVVGPEADPYTGQMQLGTAVLMTDADGRQDGFLLAVYSAADLSKELKRMSFENTVNSFAVQDKHIAAAIGEDGVFIAHTDPDMIGRNAISYLSDYEPNMNYEGFTEYDGESMCVSASTADGKTLLFLVPEHDESQQMMRIVLIAVFVLLILVLLYFPSASLLTAKAMSESNRKSETSGKKKSPLAVFYEGYFIYLTLLAIVALIASIKGWWPSFIYVFSGGWSKGVNLFSLWAALFVIAVSLCVGLLLRTLLRLAENRLTLRGKTISRLAQSLVSYVIGIFLVFTILDMFGVNTKALLASAGIITIAVGMGAQSMASDLLAGFFMMMEGSVHVGDHVSVSGVTGYVTDMGIRTTEITDEDGNVVILNNSQVSHVLNMSRNHQKKEQES